MPDLIENEDINLTCETIIWETAGDYLGRKIPNPIPWEDSIEIDKVKVIGNDVYRLVYFHCSDESILKKESWYKNGVLHRGGDLPAKIVYSKHGISEEAYLDEWDEEYYLDGEYIKTNDRSDEIWATRDLATRRYFGDDV